MNEMTKKYLTKMYEGVCGNLAQLDQAYEGINQQLDQFKQQREEMITAREELSEMLGITPEEEEEAEDSSPNLKLVDDK